VVLALSVLWWIFLVCLAMGIAAWAVFWLAIRTGQFDDPEAAAREMLELDEHDHAQPERQPARDRSAASGGQGR
jgi:cbb3-type cytochrome oxidase maturation protein